MKENSQAESLNAIRVTADELSEVSGSSTVVVIRRDQIQRIELKHGICAERPALQIAFGSALIIPGLWALWHFVGWLIAGGTLIYDLTAYATGSSLLGIFTIVMALRRRNYLHIHLNGDSRKLAFGRTTTGSQIRDFLDAIRLRFACEVVDLRGRSDGATLSHPSDATRSL